MTNYPVVSRSAVAAYELLFFPVWIFSFESLRILVSNKAARDWLGYDAETLHSMTIADIRPEEDRARLRERSNAFDAPTGDGGFWTVIARSGDRYSVRFKWSRVRFEDADAVVASIYDVTQIAKAEAEAKTLSTEVEALRRSITLSGQHLSDIVDALPGMMAVLSPEDHRIIAVTDDYARSVMAERRQLIGMSLFDLLSADPAQPEADGLRALRASLKRVEELRVPDILNIRRYPLRMPDGAFQDRLWLLQNKPVFGGDGQIVSIVHRVEDVTDLLAGGASANGDTDRGALALVQARTALLALRERDMRLRAAERLLDVGSWELDSATKRIRWSGRVFEMTGFPAEKGEPDFDAYAEMVHPNDREAMAADFGKFLDGNAQDAEFQHRLIRPDGKTVHIRAVGSRHSVDGRDIVVGFVQDISRYREAEERLQQVLRLKKVAGYMARVGGWRVDLDPIRITWSSETAGIYDEPDGFSPTLEQVIEYCLPKYREQVLAAFTACAERGEPFDGVREIITAKGRRVWVRSIGAAVYDDDGKIVAVEGAFQDITDMVEARVAADETSQRLSQTLEHISDAFLLLDADWRCAFLNGQGETLLQRKREDLLGQNIWDEFPEAVGGTFQMEYERAVATNEAVRFQEYFAPLDAWFEVNAYPTPEGLAIYFRNVTRERQREAHLRLLEAAVERQNDMVVITEAKSVTTPLGPKIVYVNDSFIRQMGYSREEVIGKTPRILQGPKTQRSELDRIKQALTETRSARAEVINYTKSGKEIWIELDIAPVADDSGNYTHWVAVQRNITERKLAENAEKETKERFRLIANATGTAVWDWDVAQNTLWWSDGMTEIFGHETDATGAIPTVWHKNVDPKDIERLDKELADFCAGEREEFREQYRFRRADGTWATVEDRAFAIRDDKGGVVRVIGSLTDISERLQLEDRLRQAQKMEAVGQLTGGVAHDFNNLLTVILGSAEILAERLTQFPDLQRLAGMTMDAAEKGAELTSRLLAFSRKQTLEPKVLDIGRLVQRLEPLMRRTLPENIDIKMICTDGLWTVEVDPGQFESAMLNLVINARDAMLVGGDLTIEVINVALDEGYAAVEPDLQAGDYVMVAVTDTGHGIPRDLLNRVFEPFFTTKEVGKGSGLGLSMVFGFVKQSKGHIRIYSEPDEGTTVRLYFPRSASAEQDSLANLSPPRIVGGNEVILVVEDNEMVCEHVMALVGSLGYRAIKATNGRDALAILAKTPEIDLLFTDVVMPGGMGGRELAEAARAMRPGLKVLFTSGYTENSIVHNGRLDRGVELISKPYGREQLSQKLRKVLASGGS